MSQSYTHFLIAESKAYRPTPQAVCRFLDQLIQSGSSGSDYRIEFAPVIRCEPQSRELRNPITGRSMQVQSPSRRRRCEEQVPTAAHALQRAEHEREYDLAIVSILPPANPPLEIGGDDNGIWQSWKEPCHLRICCHVRGSLVRLSLFRPGENPNAPLTEEYIENYTTQFDEDCGEDELDGLFVHPEVPDGMLIPNAGCGRFWVEFEYGKWLYPRLKDGTVNLLAPAVIDLATKTFGTQFIEACQWG